MVAKRFCIVVGRLCNTPFFPLQLNILLKSQWKRLKNFLHLKKLYGVKPIVLFNTIFLIKAKHVTKI